MANILIVDDVRDNRETLRRVLNRLGHTSDVACDVAEAVYKVENDDFDLVLMDITIPQTHDGEPDIYGGIDATKRIRSNPRYRELPIVAVTAHGFHSQRKAILDSGCCEILEKGPEAFIARAREMLERRLGTVTVPQMPPKKSASQSVSPTQTAPSSKTQASLSSSKTEPPKQPEGPSKAPNNPFPLPADAALMERVLEHTGKASRIASTMYLEAKFLEAKHGGMDAELLESIQKLHKDWERAQKHFMHGSGPRGNESLRHWVINGITSLGIDCESLKLVGIDTYPSLGEQLHEVQRSLRAIEGEFEQDNTLQFEDTKQWPMNRVQESTVETPRVESTLPTPSSVSQQESRPVPTPTLSAAPTTNTVQRSARLLVVDDEGDVRISMERMLMQLGHETYSCGDGAQALKMLESQPFDVCLLDLNMPGLGGMELIRRIRASQGLSQLPLIVISGSGQLGSAAEAIELGADDYLTKPPHLPLLKARINSCLKQMDSRRAELAKFLPKNVIESSLSDPEKMNSGRSTDISAMFCDIRGFSRISDRVGAQETIRWIRDVMDRLSSCILSHGGTLVDYIGDEVIAMWGAPHEIPDHACQACQCALVMQSEVETMSLEWEQRLGEAFKVGIGVHSGTAVVGNMASKHRFKYGPLGPTVNIASRVQGATKYLRSSVLITGATAQMLPANQPKRRLCKVQVMNIPNPLDLFELASLDAQSQLRDQRYEEALKAFESREFESAMRVLSSLLSQFPNDGPTQLLMSRLIEFQFAGENFSPVWVLPGK